MPGRVLGLLVAVFLRFRDVFGDGAVPAQSALGVRLADEDLQQGAIAGKLYIRKPIVDASSPSIDYFSVYWGSDASTKAAEDPFAISYLNSSSGPSPTCSGISCDRITIERQGSSWLIGRGMSGYQNNEQADIYLPSAGKVTVTSFRIESGWDFLFIDGAHYSGSYSYGAIEASPTGPSVISWQSDVSVTQDGWELTFEPISVPIHEVDTARMLIPPAASHVLVYSGNGFGEMQTPAFSPIHDMFVIAPPSSLTFADSSDAPHHISGPLQIAASQSTDVLRYDVFFGAGQVRGVCSGLMGFRFQPGLHLTDDCSGNELHLKTLAAESASGPTEAAGHALVFDGTFFGVSDSSDWPMGTGSWSLVTWANPAVQPAASVRLLGKSGYNDVYGIYGDEFGIFLTWDFLPSCASYSASAGSFSCTGTSPLMRNAWTHLACTFELAELESSILKLYVNGALAQTCFVYGHADELWPVHEVTLGGHSGEFFDGMLDEVAVFQHTLTAVELNQLFTGDRVASLLPGGGMSTQLDGSVPANATTLHAVAVGQWTESEPFIIDLVDKVTPAHLPVGVDFIDSDPMLGSYGGLVTVQRALNESDISHYVAYWGASSNAKLVGYTALGSAVADGTGEVFIYVPFQAPPAGASHIVVVSAMNGGAMAGESSSAIGVALQDYAPPSVTAQEVTFTDTDPFAVQVSGEIRVTAASDETDVVSYNLYFSHNGIALQLIQKLPASGASQLTHSLSGALLPASASSILVLVEGSQGEAQTGVATSGLDFNTLDSPGDIAFQDEDSGLNSLGGTITIQRAIQEASIQAYELYWAQGGALPEPTRLSLLREVPLTSGTTTTITFEMIDSYGDGWNNAYYYIRTGTGDLIAEGTFTSGYSETHTIDNVPVAETLTLTVTQGGWPSEISWTLTSGSTVLSSSTDTFPTNMPFSVSGGSPVGESGVTFSPGLLAVSLPHGTAPSADHFLVLCKLDSGAESAAAWVAISDFAPPSAVPSSIAFQDTDEGVRSIAGLITLGRAADESSITEYKVYFGSGTSEKLARDLQGLQYQLFVFAQDGTFPALNGRQPTSEGVHERLRFLQSDFGWPEAFQVGFAARWTGFFRITVQGTYSFKVLSDNGCKVWVAGDLVIDASSGAFGEEISTGQVSLPNGTHALQVDFFVANGTNATLVLEYSGQETAWAWANVSDIFYGVETNAIASISTSGTDPLAMSLGTTVLPARATHLLAVGSSPSGESEAVAVILSDYALPRAAASDVTFSDVNPMAGLYAGTVNFLRAVDEASITQYLLFWGSSASTPDSSLGSLGHYLVSLFSCSRSDLWFDGISVVDWLWFGGSANSLEDTSLTSFRAQCEQRCLSSVPGCTGFVLAVGAGLANCQFYVTDMNQLVGRPVYGYGYGDSGNTASDMCLVSRAVTGAIDLPSSEAPSGATHLVVVSAYENNSMATGAGVALVDYATISVAPASITFEDTDGSSNAVGGTVTIGAVADESEISGYVVYWGESNTSKLLPGGNIGLHAEFFALQECPCHHCAVNFSSRVPFLTQSESSLLYSPSRPGGSFSAWPGLNSSELFAARWTGWLYLHADGDYQITAAADDACKLFIDGVEVLSMSASSGFSQTLVYEFMSAGLHQVELQYYQCRGASGISVSASGPATGFVDMSLWALTRHGTFARPAFLTAPKTGADVEVSIPAGTAVPGGATHLLAFAQASSGFDSLLSTSTALLDFVQPTVAAEAVSFNDVDPTPGVIQGVITIRRAQNEDRINAYKVYWGSSATDILNISNSTARRLSTSRPSCTGLSCSDIQITGSGNSWVVSRGSYDNHESADIILTGPAEIMFLELNTETCCDKLYFPQDVFSGYTTPEPLSLGDGTHAVQWVSDFSVTSGGWSFSYTYLGSSEGTSPSLIAMIPKPEHLHDLQVQLERQQLIGSHFIVKAAYDSTESDTSVAVEIQDLAPEEIPVGNLSFSDTHLAMGYIGGSLEIGQSVSGITGYRIYWGSNSTHLIAPGFAGLEGQYFYLSYSPDSIPDMDSLVPDLVKIDLQVFQAQTLSAWPGLSVEDNFAVRWTGYVKIEAAGMYRFTLDSDEGSRLFINGALVVDNDGVHGMQSSTGEISLVSGFHSLQLNYFEGLDESGMILEYSGPDTAGSRVVIPQSALRHGSLNNALIGEVVAASSSATVLDIQNLSLPEDATHLIVRAFNDQGESLTGASVELNDAFRPTSLAGAVQFVDEDPTEGLIAGTIVVEAAADPSTVSHYVIYWGSSSDVKLDQVPLAEIESTGGSGNQGSCGLKGEDTTPLRFSRNGVNGPKIVNGQDASHCEWRWQVSLRYSSGFHFCGGALISPKWVMSAAHCVDGAGSFVVVVGDYDKDSPSDAHERTHSVHRVISHESYDSYTMSHDFALIELEQEVDMTQCVGTACLPDAHVEVGQDCYITGWGTLSSGGSTPARLQEGLVIALSNTECNARYAGEILDDMLCAQGTAAGGIVDACQGDSGGPLVCQRADGRHVLHGATSWGYGCAQAQYPGVWARIASILPWIHIHTGLQSPGDSSVGNLTYNLSSQSIPSSATHLLVYTAMHGAEMESGISIPLVDYAPVDVVPSSINFTDEDASPGELGGVIHLGRASDETQVTGYAVYWGSSETQTLELLAEVSKGSGTLEIAMATNTPLPSAATHLLGFAITRAGRGLRSVSQQILDVDDTLSPGGLVFEDTDASAGLVGGTVTVQRAASTSGISAYNLYFSDGNCSTLGAQIASVAVSQSGRAPLCIEGNACSDITITQEASGRYVISRGMSGYRNDEHAKISVDGPGSVHFSRFSTEMGYDMLRVDQASFSGEALPASVALGPGPKEIEWTSDYSVTRDGWVVTFEAQGSFGDVGHTLPNGTFLPAGASRMLAFSVANGAEYRQACASTPVVDYAPPNQVAQNVWFEDEDSAGAQVAGTITILQARQHTVLLEYRIYWGMTSTTRLPNANMLLSVVASSPGTNLTAVLSATALPTNATHLLVFSASAQGEAPRPASTEIVDFNPAQETVQNLSFTDTDSAQGVVSGSAQLVRASDESTIESYNLYFSNGQQKISFVGSAPAPAGAARPSCRGDSCAQISITSVAAAYEVSRGTSYNNNEEAVIVITGPGLLRFTFFNTEAGYDFLQIMGTPYSGNQLPADIPIPASSHEIVWRSDGSVTTGGWVFQYEGTISEVLSIPVPQSTIPTGAVSLLVVTSGAGGEMDVGVTTPLEDYHPPMATPQSVQCQDQDTSIGVIQGTCTVRRAASEDGVTAYVVYWGMNATHAIEGVPMLGVVTLADSALSVDVPIAQTAIHSGASHLLAFAAGPGGVAPQGVSTLLVDNAGLTLSPSSLDILGTPNSTITGSVTINNAGTSGVTLNVELLFDTGSAEGSSSAAGSSSSPSSSSSSSSSSAYTLPSACLQGSLPVGKNRLIFKAKADTKEARRLHAKNLESRHGAKVKSFDHLGGLAFAELKNTSLKSYCQLFVDLENDPLVAFVEEDKTWHAIGNTIQVEEDLFLSPGKKPLPRPRVGRMHRSQSASSNARSTPNDDEFDELWGLHQGNDVDIDAPEAWAIHQGLNGRVIIAVIDTGVDYNHEDLRNQMWTNPGEIPGDGIDNDDNGFVDDVYGYNFYAGNGDPMDSNGHGTHCAGTIGAEAGNSVGVAGVSWKPQIMALKFLGPNGGSTSDAIRSVDYAVQMGAQISSNSWGGGGVSEALRAAITEAANQNHLFIVAAGNDAQNNEVTPSYPCNYNLPNMICVASTDSQNDISSFSNWGTNVVHIAAPGSRIYSTYPNNGYASLSGTSMATPHVSGVAALVLDYVPTLTYRELRQLILDSAVRFDKFASKVSTGALLNAHAALVMASDHAWARLTAPTTGAVTVPAQGSATISVELGGPRLEQREYRARLRIWSLVGDILYSRLVPILYTLHEFGSGPTVGPVGLEFADVDGGRGVIAGALTITRASPEEEATFSQYHIFWADASERRMSEAPFAALDTGSLLHDDFAFFDSSFWFAADSDTWSVSEGAAVFWGPYATSHLALARRFAPPFTVKTKAKKASGALAHMVVQIGGSDASLFGVASGVRAMFLGSQKVLVASDGHHESVPCTLGTWFEVTITVRSNSVTFADNQGCPEIVIPANIETTQHIRIGADCTGDCATNGGSMWEYFEVSGGLYATFNVPVNTLIPTNATGFVAHAWNVLGLQLNGVYAPVADHRVAVRAAQPQDVRASSPSTNPTSSLMVSWTRGLLNDCSSHFQRYEVSAQDSNSDWFAVQGCQNLVNLNSQSCLATELSSDVPYQFKVRVVCSLEETQSFWSEISATAVTHPLPAAAPTQVRARLPSSSVLLVSWQTEMMNDCEFVESVVEAQVVGQSSWFRPEGCTGLTLLNSYHCTAQALIPDTSYIFRVQTSCSDPLSSSGYSSSSTPASTLASAQDWESSQRRMLSVSMTSDLDYNTVLSTPNLKQGLIARIISDTATRLNVDASKVQVEVLAGSTLSSSRRLSTVSTVFAVTVEGVDETETPDTTSSMAQGVAFAVQAETGTASEVSVSSALSLTAATAPERILWTDLGDGSVQLTWNARPLNDCSFLAWHVVALSGSSELSPAGCSNLVNLSKTSCTVSGLDQSRSYMFAVSVLCADPAASSQRSETSDAWPLSPLPGLVSAEFSEDFSALLLTFHRVVTAAELVPTTCTDAFGNVTRDALGSGITCKVIGSQMRVTLGEGASLLLGEIIHMNTARGSAAVTSRSKAPSVVSILSATPSVTQACDPVVLLLQASGAAGRALNIKWMTDRPGSLQNLLDSATEDSASSLTLSPTLLQEILATVEGDSASMTVNVSVQVSNWLGQNATASAAVTLLKSASLIASIQASGPAQLVRQFDDPLELEVTTSIGSTCESNLEAQLTTTWHYRPSDSATWMTLAEAGLSDLSAMPNILRLAPYALPSGSHELRATAAFEGAVGESDSLAFSITVESPTLDFEISGPQSVGVGCGFELGATVAASHPDAVLSYQWACLQPDNCNSIANFAASAEVLDGSGYSGARLAVAPANVSQGAYTFSVTVTMHIASMPSEPSVSLQKEVSVLVEPGGPLPVEIITPWSSMDHISVQATRLAEAVVARVGSMADECKVPGSLVYKWVLATAAEPSQIVASLDTKVVLSGLATVTSISFEGNALLPSVSYVYALLRAESSSQLTQGEESATLQDAASLGISVSKSSPFVADAAPSAGLAVATPEMGEALKTKFVLSTAGWSDEDSLSLRYAFYLFPVAGSFNITVGEDGKLRSSPAFQPPLINWDDPDSAEYWVKLGGLAVRGFGSAASAESRLPSNTFVTVARARDKLGAVADSAILGPVVQQPASLSTSDLTNVLAESQTSSDPSQILMSVQTVMSMSGSVDGESSAVTAMALDALASVTTMVDGSDETLQQMGTAVTQVIAGSAADKSSLTKAADVIESCLALASDGVSAAAGASLLGGIASIGGSSSQLDSTEVKSVSSKLTSLVSNLGQAAVKFLQAGEVQEINSVDESGEGIKMAVTKQSSAEVASLGVQMQRLSIPAGAFAGRRLDASCGEMEVQVTEWLKSNPYSYTQKVVGSEGSVAESADVFSVEITSCSFPAVVLEPVSVSLPLPSFGAGSDFVPTCARFDSSSDSWTSDGVSTSIDSASGKVTCSSTHTKTSYAVFADVARTSTTTAESEEMSSSLPSSGLSATFQVAFSAVLICAAA